MVLRGGALILALVPTRQGIHRDLTYGVDKYDWFGHNGDAFGSNARAYRKDDGSAAFASAFNTCNYGALHRMGFRILDDDMNDAGASEYTYEYEPTANPAAATEPTTNPNAAGEPTANPTKASELGSSGGDAMPTGSPTDASLESPSSGSFKATAVWLECLCGG